MPRSPSCPARSQIPRSWFLGGGSGDAIYAWLHFSLLQTAQRSGEQDETSIAEIPQAHHTSKQGGEEQAPLCHRLGVQAQTVFLATGSHGSGTASANTHCPL